MKCKEPETRHRKAGERVSRMEKTGITKQGGNARGDEATLGLSEEEGWFAIWIGMGRETTEKKTRKRYRQHLTEWRNEGRARCASRDASRDVE